MKLKLLSTLILVVILTACCGKGTKKVDYQIAEGYFVRNTIDPALILTEKITSQEQFNELFGMATVMGKTPTPIDFATSYVAALVLPETDHATELSVESFTRRGNEAELVYAVKQGDQQSYSIRPLLVLIVEGQNDDRLLFTPAHP